MAVKKKSAQDSKRNLFWEVSEITDSGLWAGYITGEGREGQRS